MVTLLSSEPKETEAIGKIFGQKIKKRKGQIILALIGPLGSGKTTFIKGLAKGLGIKKRILSPTFLIFKEFKLPGRKFYHFDCYRINSIKELKVINFQKILQEKNSIIAIEWAEKILKFLPKKNLLIFKFKYQDEKIREIKILP